MRSASLATRATQATEIGDGYFIVVGVQRTGSRREGGVYCRESACREIAGGNSDLKLRTVADGPLGRLTPRCQREVSPSRPNYHGYGPEFKDRIIDKDKSPTGQVCC